MICFFFNDTATTKIYTLSLHAALPIFDDVLAGRLGVRARPEHRDGDDGNCACPEHETSPSCREEPDYRVATGTAEPRTRSEEHTSELQSRQYLVCRLLLEKKKYLVFSL